MGWVQHETRSRIMYFDSHFVNSLDHVKVLYYPNYEPGVEVPLGDPSCRRLNKCMWGPGRGTHLVELNVSKATRLVERAMELQEEGFATPLPSESNLHAYDLAYKELNQRTGGEAHRVRSGDDTLPLRYPSCLTNSVAEMLWKPNHASCPWRSEVPRLIRDLDLGP